MLRSRTSLMTHNGKVSQALISSSHGLFNQHKIISAASTRPHKRKAVEIPEETDDHVIVRQLLCQIAEMNISSPHWHKTAIDIRTQLEGKELSLIDVVNNNGQELIHKLGRKIELGDTSSAHSLTELTMVRKLCLIFHPDKWNSRHSGQVFAAIRGWAMNAKETLEGYFLRAELHKKHRPAHEALLRELKDYIHKTHEHLRKSGEINAETFKSSERIVPR